MSTVLPDLSDAVSSAADGLVRVEGRDRLPATGIICDAEGLIVTSHHVLERDENIIVGFQDGESVAAELIGRDPSTDLAVLRTPKKGSNVPDWADQGSLRVGHLALALGRPGASVRATMGIISVLGNAWRTPAGGPVDRYLQTDTVMYRGFSGGPLVDVQGRFVGLNSSALVCGVSITVPQPTLSQVVQDLEKHVSVRRAYLGVGAQPTRLPGVLAEELGQETDCYGSRWSRAAQQKREACSWGTRWSPLASRPCGTWMTYSMAWAASVSASPSRSGSYGADSWWMSLPRRSPIRKGAVKMTTLLPKLNSDLGELADRVRQILVQVSVGRRGYGSGVVFSTDGLIRHQRPRSLGRSGPRQPYERISSDHARWNGRKGGIGCQGRRY